MMCRYSHEAELSSKEIRKCVERLKDRYKVVEAAGCQIWVTVEAEVT